MNEYKYKYHGCDEVKATDHPIKEFVFSCCGCVNIATGLDQDADEACACVPPKTFEWSLPSGKIGNPVVGYRYVTAQGTEMSHEEYIETFGLDPEIALKCGRARVNVRGGHY
jgi:hypothetical protein